MASTMVEQIQALTDSTNEG